MSLKRNEEKREARRESFAVCSKKEAEERERLLTYISSQRNRKMLTKSLVVDDVGIEKLVIAKGYFSE